MRRWLKRTGLLLIVVPAVAALLLAVLVIWPLPEPPLAGVRGDVALRNVRIVDVESGRLSGTVDVHIRAGRIAAIGQLEAVPADVIDIDGAGKFLMPGLWDLHTHSNSFAAHYQHPLFIAHGVIAVREMWGCLSQPDSFIACGDQRRDWNAALERGGASSPHYVGQSSFQIDGGEEVPDGFPTYFRLQSAADADALAAFYANAGVDFLKVYSDVSPEAYRWLTEAASRHDLGVAGHRPIRVPLAAVLDAGQRSIEHGRLFALECYAGADRFRALPDPLSAYDTGLIADLVDRQDRERCGALMHAMAGSDTSWVPTLQTVRMGAMAHDVDYRNDARLRFVPTILQRLMWVPDANRNAATALDERGRNVRAALYRLALQQVGEAHAAGVRILAGTDAFDTYVFPGASLHDELGLLVEAGLSPAAALRAATLDAAEFMGRGDDWGSVTVGKRADLLLLAADPLRDIGHTRAIDALLFNGHYYDRAALDELLAFAEARASSPSQNAKTLWRAVRSPLVRVQFAD